MGQRQLGDVCSPVTAPTLPSWKSPPRVFVAHLESLRLEICNEFLVRPQSVLARFESFTLMKLPCDYLCCVYVTIFFVNQHICVQAI